MTNKRIGGARAGRGAGMLVLIALLACAMVASPLAYADEVENEGGREFKFQVTVDDSSGLDFIIPTSSKIGGGFEHSYDWRIDWGHDDSTGEPVTELTSGAVTAGDHSDGVPHEFPASGTYTITINPGDPDDTDAWLVPFGFGDSSAELTGANALDNRAKVTKALSPITPEMTREDIHTAPTYEWAYTFDNCANLTMGSEFTFDAAAWDEVTAAGGAFAQYMFRACSGDGFNMGRDFNLPTNITDAGHGFCYNMFVDCDGDGFTMNGIFNLPQKITTVVNNFAVSMFSGCGGAAFTMNDVFNMPPDVTVALSHFGSAMFMNCSGPVFAMNDVFNLPQGITSVENNFAYRMFKGCKGNAFTMNAVFNLPPDITQVELVSVEPNMMASSFANEIFSGCGGDAFTMNDVFNMPQGITDAGESFARQMFYQCNGPAFEINSGFKFPLLDAGHMSSKNMFAQTFSDIRIAPAQVRTMNSIINGNEAPTNSTGRGSAFNMGGAASFVDGSFAAQAWTGTGPIANTNGRIFANDFDIFADSVGDLDAGTAIIMSGSIAVDNSNDVVDITVEGDDLDLIRAASPGSGPLQLTFHAESGVSETVNVNVIANAGVGIGAAPDLDMVYGDEPAAQPVSISKASASNIAGLRASLSSGDSFEITKPISRNLLRGGSSAADVHVSPLPGLPAGSRTAKLVIRGIGTPCIIVPMHVDVAKKELTISGVSAGNKTYDGGAGATVTGTPRLVGVVGNDEVILNSASASASFANSNAGTGKAVAFTGYAITGGDAGNYDLTQPVAAANIAPKTVTVTARAHAINQNASLPALTANDVVYEGLVGGDTVADIMSGTALPRLTVPDSRTPGTSVIDFGAPGNEAELNTAAGANYTLRHVYGMLTIAAPTNGNGAGGDNEGAGTDDGANAGDDANTDDNADTSGDANTGDDANTGGDANTGDGANTGRDSGDANTGIGVNLGAGVNPVSGMNMGSDSSTGDNDATTADDAAAANTEVSPTSSDAAQTSPEAVEASGDVNIGDGGAPLVNGVADENAADAATDILGYNETPKVDGAAENENGVNALAIALLIACGAAAIVLCLLFYRRKKPN